MGSAGDRVDLGLRSRSGVWGRNLWPEIAIRGLIIARTERREAEDCGTGDPAVCDEHRTLACDDATASPPPAATRSSSTPAAAASHLRPQQPVAPPRQQALAQEKIPLALTHFNSSVPRVQHNNGPLPAQARCGSAELKRPRARQWDRPALT